MNSLDYRKIVEYIVNCYKSGEYVTVMDASIKFDCSVSSIRKYIARLKKSEDIGDINLYNDYLEVANMNRLKGQVIGGKNGKRKSSLSLEYVSNLCEYIIENDCTLRQMEEMVDIPKSTLHENLASLNDSRLHEIYEKHHRNSLNDYNNDVENGSDFHSIGSEISKRCTKR